METISARFEQALSFVTVAEAGSFTAAAARLGRSKAHLSKQVSELERALSVQLLLRSTRRLNLTEAGRVYLDYCRQLRDTLLEGDRALSATRSEVSGTLRLSAPTSFGDAFLVDLLHAFQQRHPRIEIELDLSIQRRDLIAEGYDFAIRASRSIDEHLVARAIGFIRELLVVSPALPELNPIPQTPEQLARLHSLRNTHFSDDPEWLLSGADGTSHRVRLQSRFAANSFALLLRAAEAGLGVARLPRYMVDASMSAGRLLQLLPEFHLAPVPVYLVYPQRRHLPWRDRVFRDFALDWFASPGHASMLS